MTVQQEAIFEAPVTHESGQSPEGSFEWEVQEGSHLEGGFGAHEMVQEGELGGLLQGALSALGLGEQGFEQGAFEQAGFEGEWSPEGEYTGEYAGELSGEGEGEFGGLLQGVLGALGLGEQGSFEQGSFEQGSFEQGAFEQGAYEQGAFEQAGFEGELSPEGEYTGEYSTEYSPEHTGEFAGEGEGELGGLLSGILGGLGLGEQEGASPEADRFFGGILKTLRRAILPMLPMARQLAPVAAKAISGLVPGGVLAGPLAALLPRLLREGEGEIAAFEAQMLASPEVHGESAANEAIQELALTEVLANEAVVAENETEASAILNTTLPLTITIMRAGRTVRPVLPTLVQGNRQLIRVLGAPGTNRQLYRAVPAIQRRTVRLLQRLERSGRPVTGPAALGALAAASRSVLGDSRRLRRVLERNAAVRLRSAPPLPAQVTVFAPRTRRRQYR